MPPAAAVLHALLATTRSDSETRTSNIRAGQMMPKRR
jgi:hypothetical protein